MKKLVFFSIFCLIFIGMSFQSFAITQYNYLFRNNDGNELAASAAASENTSMENLQKEQEFRLRIGVKTDESDNHALQKNEHNLEIDDHKIASIAVDSNNEFAYVGTLGSPAKVLKIDLQKYMVVGSLILDSEITNSSSIENLNTINLSKDGRFAYLASYSDPLKIIKIDLTSFTYQDHLEFLSGTGYATSAVMDPDGSYLYIGTKNGEIIRVDLYNFSEVSTEVINLPDDETGLYSALINDDGSRIYFGTYTIPGKIVTINTEGSNFYKLNTYILSTGNELLKTAVLDSSTDFAYFGTDTNPGKIIKLDLLMADKELSTIIMPDGTGNFHASEFSDINNEIYFANNTNPGKVITINLDNFSISDTDILPLKNDHNFYAITTTHDGKLLVGTNTLPGKLFQLEESSNIYQFRLEYGINTRGCDQISEWKDVFDNNDIDLIDSIHIGEPKSNNVEDLLSDASGTFINGALMELDSQTSPLELNTENFTEIEYSLKTSFDAEEANYCFRVTNAGNPGAFNYQTYPTLNVGDLRGIINDYQENKEAYDFVAQVCENETELKNCVVFDCEDNINNPACIEHIDAILEKQALESQEEEQAIEIMQNGENCIHNDLPADYTYCPEIIYNYELGTFTGDGNGNFRPDSGVLRAEAAKILNVAKKINISKFDNEGDAGFNDTSSNQWYIKYLKASKETKVIYGYPDGSFKPAQEAIRAEFVTMLTRALNINVSTACDQEYAPDIIVNSYWGPSACYLIKNDILDLDGSTNFNPTESMTREDIAKMLYNARNLIE